MATSTSMPGLQKDSIYYRYKASERKALAVEMGLTLTEAYGPYRKVHGCADVTSFMKLSLLRRLNLLHQNRNGANQKEWA